jgi:hypothetical protein
MSARGTTNRNDRGSAASRRARREWLIATYAADVPGHCRCYRCGKLLDLLIVTVDRIIPGCLGGTYRRNNIRPACMTCNSVTGTQLREELKAKAS